MQRDNAKAVRYMDKSLKNISDKIVKYYVINYSDSYVPSMPSDTLEVYFPDKNLPLPPEEANIIQTDDTHLKLIWKKSGNRNIKGYNVYMEKPIKKQLNKELLPANHNYYDKIEVQGGNEYIFSVESVGRNDMKSTNQTTVKINLLPEYVKLILDIKRVKNGIEISWKKYPNTHLKEIALYKQEGENKSLLVKRFANEEVHYTDTLVKKGKNYYYSMYGKVENGANIRLNNGESLRY